MRMGLIALQIKILIFEIEEITNTWIDFHPRQGQRLAAQLLLRLF